MSKNVVVVGAQWGDEGKGKIVDWLTESVQGVVRFNGGHNAGHTLVINGLTLRKQGLGGSISALGRKMIFSKSLILSVTVFFPVGIIPVPSKCISNERV